MSISEETQPVAADPGGTFFLWVCGIGVPLMLIVGWHVSTYAP